MFKHPAFPVTRFAPSPSGYLHLGHAFSALFAQAASEGGRFLLRIEDIDISRCRPAFEAALKEDLCWLGIKWDGQILRQSDRFPVYQKFIHMLADAGLLYPCFCTRRDIQREIKNAPTAPHGPDGLYYPGICKKLSPQEARGRIESGEKYALRLHMDKAVKMTGPLKFTDNLAGTFEVAGAACGDVVLARKDVPGSYHLSVVVDDAFQGVNLITRGEDLLPATHIHRILQALLGLPEPLYHHHPLLVDENGQRYAKRNRAKTLRSLRAAGHRPEDVRAMAGYPSA